MVFKLDVFVEVDFQSRKQYLTDYSK
jgi:hypothetical protein